MPGTTQANSIEIMKLKKHPRRTTWNSWNPLEKSWNYCMQPRDNTTLENNLQESKHTCTLESLLNNFLIKDTKKTLSYSRFRKLTNSLKSNSSTNKNAMINNVYHYH